MRKFTPTILGIALFALLYFRAAQLYPGGNQTDKTAPGFDWLNNYWCDLLGPIADNGQANPARPIAMLATAILCAALANFWWHLAGFWETSRMRRTIFRNSGAVSMATALILFTPFHDTAIVVSGGSGVAAIVFTFAVLRQKTLQRHFAFGVFCLALVALNNFIYWTKSGLGWLPIVQKVTFLVFLGWVFGICWVLQKNEGL